MKASTIYAIASLTSKEQLTNELFATIVAEAQADKAKLHAAAEAAKTRRAEAATAAKTPEGQAKKAAVTAAKLSGDPTAVQVLAALTREHYRGSADIRARLAGEGYEISPQKLAALLRQLEKAGKVVSAPAIEADNPKKGYDAGADGCPFKCKKKICKPYKLA